ncbi:MAG: class I SAM-dependent methyltransferase [Roseobacter sp.]
MSVSFLDKLYDVQGPASTRDLYDAWSQTYDDEVARHGYVTPGRCAEALAMYVDDQEKPILDFGCGTGLSGLALKLRGFSTIDGLDLSADMLDDAKRKRLYRNLCQTDGRTRLTHSPGDYAAIAAIGVIGVGAAPTLVLHNLMHGLAKGGKLVVSFNDHTLEDPSFEAGLNEWLDCGAATLLFKEYGPHLPGINLKANVYVIEKY